MISREFAGLQLLDFPRSPDEPLPAGAEREGPQAWRFGLDANPVIAFDELLADFVKRVDTTRVAAVLTGAAAPATPLLAALPRLERLWVRGAEQQRDPLLDPIKHDALCTLVFQTSRLSPRTVAAVAECELPALEHLEFHLGDPDHGASTTPADVAWLLAGDRLPNLRHLGLRNAIHQDAFAVAVAHAPVVAQLRTLDLSLGTLGDADAAALLAGQPLGHLTKLDLHHHFLSAQMQQRLRQAWPGVEIDLSEAHPEDDEWGRSIAVTE